MNIINERIGPVSAWLWMRTATRQPPFQMRALLNVFIDIAFPDLLNRQII